MDPNGKRISVTGATQLPPVARAAGAIGPLGVLAELSPGRAIPFAGSTEAPRRIVDVMLAGIPEA